MKTVLMKLGFVVLLMNLVVNVQAKSITAGGTSVDVGDPTTVYGPSSGYDVKGDTASKLKDFAKRVKDLRKAKKDLLREKRKTKDKERKKEIDQEVKEVLLELEKVFRDEKKERDLASSGAKPKNKEEARIWKEKKRQLHLDNLAKLEKKRKEKEAKKKKNKMALGDFPGLGGDIITSVVSAHGDVLANAEKMGDIEDELEYEGCSEVNDNNAELCYELNAQKAEAHATLEESENQFKELSELIPPLGLATGIYVIYDELKELQDSYKELRLIKKGLINCEEHCEMIEGQVEAAKEIINLQEVDDKAALDEIHDAEKEKRLELPVEAELVIPGYLANNKDVPFSYEDSLPLAFILETGDEMENFKSAHIEMNGEELPVTFFPEAGILRANYKGPKEKEEFEGKIIVKTIDNQELVKSFKGVINNKKPEVKITSKPATTFSKGSFKVKVKGEFDKIEISGVNVKSKTINFEKIKTSYEMKVKALSKGAASINVLVTRTSKGALVDDSQFGETTQNTDETGRIIRPETDLFQSMNLGETSKEGDDDKGLCCEDVGSDGVCEGCHPGKKTRKACRKLNKVPGINFKAFKKTGEFSCTKL